MITVMQPPKTSEHAKTKICPLLKDMCIADACYMWKNDAFEIWRQPIGYRNQLPVRTAQGCKHSIVSVDLDKLDSLGAFEVFSPQGRFRLYR